MSKLVIETLKYKCGCILHIEVEKPSVGAVPFHEVLRDFSKCVDNHQGDKELDKGADAINRKFSK